MTDIIQCDHCKGHGYLIEDPAYEKALFATNDGFKWIAVEKHPPRYIAPPDDQADFSDLNPIGCKECNGWGCRWKNKGPEDVEIK